MTTGTDDPYEIDLPAREIHVGAGSPDRPVLLTIGVYGRNGRGSAIHGVQLTRDGALMLARDLADVLGLSLRAARFTRVWRVLRWPRNRLAVRQVERDLRRVLAAPPSEDELLRAIFGEQAASSPARIPAQRAAFPGCADDNGA